MSRAMLRPIFSTASKPSEVKPEKTNKKLRPMAEIAPANSKSGPATRRRQTAKSSNGKPAVSTTQPATRPSGKALKTPKKLSKRATSTPDDPADHRSPRLAVETPAASTSNFRSSATPEASSIPRSPSTSDTESPRKRTVPITPEPTPPLTNKQGDLRASLSPESDFVAPIHYHSESPKPITLEGSGGVPIGANPHDAVVEPSRDPKTKASTKSHKTIDTNPRREGRKLRRLRRRIDNSPVEKDKPIPDTNIPDTTTAITSQSKSKETLVPDYTEAPRRSNRLAGLPDFGWVDGRRPTRHPPSPGSARLEADRTIRRTALEKLKQSRAARSKGKEKEKSHRPFAGGSAVENIEEKEPAAKPPVAGPREKAAPGGGVKSGRVGKHKGSIDPSRFFKS